MKITPIKGHDIGFTPKGWKQLETVVSRTSQEALPETIDLIDRYFESLLNLKIVSSKISSVETDRQDDVVRDYSSPWGGREKFLGMSYSANAIVTFEGSVLFPRSATEEEMKLEIAKDFSDGVWEEIEDCNKIVESIKDQMHEAKIDTKAKATVNSISPNTDGSYKVNLVLFIEIEGGESVSSIRSRMEEERGIDKYDKMMEDQF